MSHVRSSSIAAAPDPSRADRMVRGWLIVTALLVTVMITVGGATRLTGSGLSITEWNLIGGIVPPLSDAAWLEAFEKYKTIPQYIEVNKGMTLDGFKSIFWWEWGHRFIGRMVGFVFGLPLAWFWWTGRLRKSMRVPLVALLVLGGLQGRVGWFMVQSGLADRVLVSPYRLAMHLGLALLVLAGLTWLVMGLGRAGGRGITLRTVTRGQAWLAAAIVALVLLQALAGAFVAGLKAGLTYNTWPLMDGHLIPPGLDTLSPWFVNLFENVTTVQFDHRMLAYVLVVVVLVHVAGIVRSADDERVRHSGWLLGAAVLAQAGLGIWTLLEVVPLSLALLHQAGAAILLVIAVRHCYLVARAVRFA